MFVVNLKKSFSSPQQLNNLKTIARFYNLTIEIDIDENAVLLSGRTTRKRYKELKESLAKIQ